MKDDVSIAQARSLVMALRGYTSELQQSIASAERHVQRLGPRAAGVLRYRQKAASLRRDLHEAKRLISRLHQRFPILHDATRIALSGEHVQRQAVRHRIENDSPRRGDAVISFTRQWGPPVGGGPHAPSPPGHRDGRS
ncbi:hypothetical protein BKG76_11310 [Mycobacteroides franklinii]|uniref:Uncharacterized protein n=1 Tax=Mycobacteroides franklinii TaxID=948102 RepID=A0A1S1L754_9MYCO|nr:hypothetical protein BKG76_11310 [Mycobacteroides franklinii]